MIEKLQKIGNSRGVLLEKALFKLLKVEDDDPVEIIPKDEGLLKKKLMQNLRIRKSAKSIENH
ncbi:MAG: hypothetical protein GVY07_15430 [Bacteroidetes bacterium]|jgi:antitoxin component of MazEF toxin-antitoxin module|nr:hypothetical protein [Bacteroidota bacterium]